MKYCSHCGAELVDEAVVCVKCGCIVAPIPNSRVLESPDESTGVYAVLGFLIPIAGLIMFLAWNDTYPRRAKSAGKGALISVTVGIILSVIIMVCTFFVISSSR